MNKIIFLFLCLEVLLHAQPLVIAHLGAAGYAPENTITAFKMAIESGADAIEIDLRQTKDGVLVVLHDESVDRTTDGKGEVDELTYKELMKLDAGNWFDENFSGERIPTLKEVLALLNDSIKIIIELKADDDDHPGIEQRVVNMIRGSGLEDQTILKSFNPNVIKRLRKIAPEIQLCYVYALRIPWLGLIVDTGISFGSIFDIDADYLQPHRFFLSKSFVQDAQSNGYKVIAWGVESESAIQEAIEFGVDGIETDYVDRVRKYVDNKIVPK
ncbi:MAG: glycerophosphodiester phosphodiesterase [Ignavibacteriales bacterium]|nr:MAG: glycerophosphodiester phosphodiesterase [Ignavibacteriales bacterium]